MAWPSLKTWTASVVTVLDLNTEIRDRMATLKTSVADNGDISAPNAIIGAAAGNRLGGLTGSLASPTRSNTNLLLYDGGASNWAGIGTSTNGDVYVVAGSSGTPSTRLFITAAGYIVLAGSVSEVPTTVAFSATPTFDLSAGTNQKLGALTGDVTSITVSGWSGYDQTVKIRFTQDGSGGHTVAFPGGWRWAGGTAPAVATGANKVTTVILNSDDGGTTIFASLFTINA